MEFDCESHTIAYKSNTIACYDSGNLTLFSIEENSIQSITKLDYETTPFMHFSPSDNHLLVYEHEGESLQIFDLQANENLTISIDVKEGFESPKVSNAGFYLTDETFYAHIKYEKLERHPSAWHLDENEILIFGIDYDSDGVISLFDTCQNTPPLTSVDFNGCLQIDGIGDNIDLDHNDNGIKDSDENRTANSDDFLIGIFGCLIPLLICSSIILHRPTFNKTVTLIGKLPGTEGLVDVLEERRNRLDERENPLDSMDTMEGFLGILVGIFVAPWILIAYALPFLLSIVFAAVMLYLIISAGVLFLLGSAACLIFLIPFLLLGSLTG